MSLSSPIRGERTNAALAWTAAGVLAAVGAVTLVVDSPPWALMWLFVAGLVALPAVLTRDPTTVVPWPLPACGAAAAGLRFVGVDPELVGYVAVAAVSLIAVVELDAFGAAEMSPRFTVVFGAMTTMAVQAWWSVVQFLSDWWLGTGFLTTQRELQWDIVGVTCVAVVMGTVFVWYFERFERVGTYDRPFRTEESS